MGGNYEKSVYNQLMEVMDKLNTMEADQKRSRREIKSLTSEVNSLRKENTALREEVCALKEKIHVLEEKNNRLEKENQLLRDDNERMKRKLNNDSSNSSIPPSQERKGKSPNQYNGRRQTGRKAGAQPGHKGHSLTRKEVEEKIRCGLYRHRVEEIGDPAGAYVTRYRLDLEIRPAATEIRIHADENGKFQIPPHLRAEVTYGETIRAIAAFLYSEGVVANDRICTLINSISGDSLGLSTGSVYEFCRKFSAACASQKAVLEEELLNAREICTDATVIKTNGKQSYIRNFSTEKSVVYYSSEKKDLETLERFRILKEFTGTLMHDHETALYHFGTGHGECNVHLGRYLQKNTEETQNRWSWNLRSFLNGMNEARKKRKEAGYRNFEVSKIELYEKRYDELIEQGLKENANTKGRVAKKEEKALLNRLKKYKENHLLFLKDFDIHYSNNMSEKDLRICKNRQKMAGGFRTEAGREMYCDIISCIETIKRRGLNIYQSIIGLMASTPVMK